MATKKACKCNLSASTQELMYPQGFSSNSCQSISNQQPSDNMIHTVSEGEQGIDLQESPPGLFWKLEGRSMYGAAHKQIMCHIHASLHTP